MNKTNRKPNTNIQTKSLGYWSFLIHPIKFANKKNPENTEKNSEKFITYKKNTKFITSKCIYSESE